MGASQFITYAKGDTAEQAFASAVAEAEYEYGHNGYTGTIAEKGAEGFKLFPLPASVTDLSMADETANAIMNGVATNLDPDGVIHDTADDKWGPCAAFDLGNGTFLFFGWAAS